MDFWKPGAILAGAVLAAGAALIRAFWEALGLQHCEFVCPVGRFFESRYVRIVIAKAFAAISIATVELANEPAPELVYKPS